ncbi:translocation/assembly module TamB domain-containing protein [Okeania sp.]|uniref:translocation/assembly module TamB domain-containing protein n=1 Tax=Okeania sp. TaxID=3100323 RepID=UPI002B4B42B1|nr:translocation/assembly module TamB domain-containing protein [Okeania sp.]MEB3342215.1 translocation/assembly module TamB domain-containing protein [Okeania sp.]
MTNTPTNPNDPTHSSTPKKWIGIIIIGGLGLGTIAVAGGIAGTWFVQNELAPMVSESLTNLLQRPVKVGELKKFGLGYIEFGPSSLPPDSSDSISASTEAVKVTFPLGPLLFRTLILNITFGESQATIQQEADGLVVVPKLADLPPPPITVDIQKLNFSKVDVTINPSAKAKSANPILIGLNKIEARSQDQQQRWFVNLDGKIVDAGSFQVDADANLKTMEIKTKVVGQKLQLPIFANLASAVENVPNVNLVSGELDTNLDSQVKIAGNAVIVENVRGKVSLQKFQVNTELLSNPVNLNTVADIAWPKVNVKSFNANYGDIGLKVGGAAEISRNLDLQSIGLDLKAELAAISFDTLFNTATREINLLSSQITSTETKKELQEIQGQIADLRPLLDGALKTDVKVSGNLLKPVVSGKIETTEVTRVERLLFKSIATKFTVNPEFNQDFQPVKVSAGFSDLEISPLAGGKITGKGRIEDLVGSQPTPNPSQEGNPGRRSQNLEVRSQPTPNPSQEENSGERVLYATSVPLYYANSEPVDTKYSQLPTPPTLPTPPSNPTSPTSPSPCSQLSVPCSLILDLDLQVESLPVEAIAQQFAFVSPLPVGDLSTDVKVSGSLEAIQGQVKWQLPQAVYPLSGEVDILNNQVFIKNTVVKVGNKGRVNVDGNVNLENWRFKATANQIGLDNLSALQQFGVPSGLEGIVNGEGDFSGLTTDFSINSIKGNGKGIVNIAGGQVNVNGEVNNGIWQGKGKAVQLSLRGLERVARNLDIKVTPNRILSNKTDGKINGEGIAAGNINNLSLPGIKADFAGNLSLEKGVINARGQVRNGGLKGLVNTQDLPVNSLLDLGLSAANSGIITDQEQLNLIKTNIPKLKSLNGLLNGNVKLSGNLTNLDPEFLQENITANLTGNLIVEPGIIDAAGSLKGGNFKTVVKTNEISLTAVEKLLIDTGIVALKNNILSENTKGKIAGGAIVSGNIKNLSPEGINVDGDGKVTIAGGTINAKGKLDRGNFEALVKSSNLSVNQLVDLGESVLASGLMSVDQTQIETLKTQIPVVKSLNSQVNLNANLSGNLRDLSPEGINATATSKLLIDENPINIQGKFNQGNFLANIQTATINLRLLEATIRKTGLVDIPANVSLPPGIEGELIGKLSLFANINNLNPQAIAADGNGILTIGNNKINAKGKLDQGNFQAIAIADPIPLSFAKKIAKETGIVPPEILTSLETIKGNIIGNAKVAGNLDNLNPEAIAVEAAGKLLLDKGGAVNINGELVGQNWQAAVVGDKIPLEQFSTAIEKQEEAKSAVVAIRQAQQLLGQATNLPIIGGLFNSRINLSGNLQNLTPEGIKARGGLTLSELPVIQKSLSSFFGWSGKQIEIEKVAIPPNVNLNGKVRADFPAQKPPEISGINININLSDFDLASLPIEKFTKDLPLENKNELLKGLFNFQGKVIGKSIEDLNLVGDLDLRNLVVNAKDLIDTDLIDFDSRLLGKINAGLNQGVNLKIAGNNDRLELVLDKTYFPTNLLVKLDQLKLTGTTKGENFLVTLDKFPIQSLGITPPPEFGIGAVAGEASAKIALSNLRTFDINAIKADGNLQVLKPAIGYIDAKSFTADINYSQKKASLNNGIFLLGNSRYLLEAMLDINSPDDNFDPRFGASLKIEKAEIQDILTALQWFDLADIGRIAPANYAKAADIQTSPVGLPENTSIIRQLRRFAEIQALLQQQASQQTTTAVSIPPLAELDVGFSGEIRAVGSLQSGIDGQFDIKGNGWSWGAYQVDKFLLEGKYEKDTLTVKPLEVKVGKASLAFNGDLSAEQQNGELKLDNVDLAEIQKFAQSYIPPDINVTGILDLETKLGGNFADPKTVGQIRIENGTLNEQPIERAKTDFRFDSGRLQFNGGISIIGDPITYRGNVPIDLPFARVYADSNLLDIELQVKDDAFQIINILTDQLTLNSGKGEARLQVAGTLQKPSIVGLTKFTDVSITAAAFPEPVTDLKGAVSFIGDRIKVEKIQGNISQGTVGVTGVLPLLQPLGGQDVDINNPLTISLDQLNINYQKAFQGGIDGKVLITGAALQPEIGGDIEVSRGKIFLNEAAGLAGATGNQANDAAGAFEIGLNNFQLILKDGLKMISPGLANFQVAGGLTVNGTVTDIRPSGTIDLQGGIVNLFSTSLRLDPSYKNKATFIPSNGLNPMLDLQLLASAFESSGSLRTRSTTAFDAETADTPAPGTLNSNQKINIMAKARGLLSELEDNLQLTSSPERTKGQIVSLLGGNIINTFSEDRNLALANVASTALFSTIQQDIVQATGLSEFRVFPATIPKSGSQEASSLGWGLEVGIDVTDKVGASATTLNGTTELSVNYQISDKVRFRGGSNFQDNSVLSVEYETRF